jgi:hypothetical protein
MFEFLKKSTKVVVTSVNVSWKGSTHSLGKIVVKGRSFDVTIPFQNKPQDDFNLDFLKTQKKPPITITKINIKPPFKLLSIYPMPPANIAESQKVEFKVTVEPPDYNYEGPMSIDLLSDNADMAHVEISKIIVNAQGKKMEIMNKPMISDMPKGQIFKQNIHLFGIVDFEFEVKKIEMVPPFKFVSSDPKLPFKVDRKTGYLIDLFIEAPKENYGGPLEIIIS